MFSASESRSTTRAPASTRAGSLAPLFTTWRAHAPEYVIEAGGLAAFMVIAMACAVLLQHPASPVRGWLPWDAARRGLMGLAMGTTVVALAYSPWGRRSGAHLNPAVTFTFWWLGRVAAADAVAYGTAHVAGALAGTALAAMLLGSAAAVPEVGFVATRPGTGGPVVAFAAEWVIAFVLMTAVLLSNGRLRSAPYTGLIAGVLVAVFITIEDPLSGMSLNPARSLAPAIVTGATGDLWIYLLAPPAGMWAAAWVHVRRHGLHQVFCAKLHRPHGGSCLFNCRFDETTP